MQPHKIIIDTDIGDDVDDILALAFALLRPELNVKAITAVSYDTDRRCHLVARLLSCLGRKDVLFAPGLRLPMRPPTVRETQNAVRPEGYILNQYPAVREEDRNEPHASDATELIARIVEENPGEVTLASIGPLSNIAAALCRYPGIASKLRGIALMGGELTLNRAEHNIAWDVGAAEIVFNSGVPLFMGTWDVTRGFVLSPQDCERIGQQDSPLCHLLHECVDLWWPHKAWKPGPVMYDVAPILWTFLPECFTTEAMNIAIETRGDYTRGYTVRRYEAPNVRVATAMQADRVRELYLETLCGQS